VRAGVDIYSPDVYVDGPPHELFAELRRTQPVFWQDIPGQRGYWAVLTHKDLVTVAKQPQLFSASEGGIIVEDLDPNQLEMMRMMLLSMDPPRHRDYRRPLAASFHARVIAGLADTVRTITREILDAAAEMKDVEFVHDVTAALPSQLFGELMGLPREDWSKIQQLAERVTGEFDEAAGASIEMAMYGMAFAAQRRAEPPREDLTSLILSEGFAGEPMTDLDFGSFFVQLVTAGNDTTKTMLSSGLLALLQHPDQLAEVRADRSLIPGAVEEILRWANPIHYFRRTATADTSLGDTTIDAGDKVAMIFTSANRDESVFEDPQRFDVHRNPNPHLTFGTGEHTCIGLHLARLEGVIFFEELLSTFPTIELTGEPARLRSNLNNALTSLPVKLSR
jgi:cholest-4-en-3-one 26-monooxygenase